MRPAITRINGIINWPKSLWEIKTRGARHEGCPPMVPLARSCGEIGRPCFAGPRCSGACARPRPGGRGELQLAGLAVGSGPASKSGQYNKALAGGGQGHGRCPMAMAWCRASDTPAAAIEGPKGPRWRQCVLLVEGERPAAGVAHWQRPLGAQHTAAGHLHGPFKMGPQYGVAWRPGSLSMWLPLAPPNCGGLLRKWVA